jgi:uncharacterized membrane-anchored protein
MRVRFHCRGCGRPGYARGSLILLVILGAIFVFWRLSAQSMSVDDIRNFKLELLYWTAILFSNTLGTALGDFLADDSGLGFAGGAALIASLLAAIAIAAWATRISKVFLFWSAFVLTRPFGATLGDVLTKTREQGGLDFGTKGSSAILLALLIAAIAYTWLRERRGVEPARP